MENFIIASLSSDLRMHCFSEEAKFWKSINLILWENSEPDNDNDYYLIASQIEHPEIYKLLAEEN